MPFKKERNDITKTNTQAIVNTTNDQAVVGTGYDSAIYNAVGYSLLVESFEKGSRSYNYVDIITPKEMIGQGGLMTWRI